MRIILTTFAIAAALLLSGCASLEHANNTYGQVESVKFNHAGKVYDIYDRPDLSQLVIDPPTGDMLGGAIMQGLTFGAYPGSSGAVMRLVADDFLRERKCAVVSGWLVAEPLWEFTYTCQPAN